MEYVPEETREQLESEKHRINDEIRNYPTPIAGCDAQFNFLLEERARIARELGRLEQTTHEAGPLSDDNR